MECWKCGEKIDLTGSGKISVRQTCEKCHAWLHCCVNCKNYQPGLPNDCKVPGTDPIRDREAANFCDEFVLMGQKLSSGKGADLSSIAKSLFKDEGADENLPEKLSPEERLKKLFGE